MKPRRANAPIAPMPMPMPIESPSPMSLAVLPTIVRRAAAYGGGMGSTAFGSRREPRHFACPSCSADW